MKMFYTNVPDSSLVDVAVNPGSLNDILPKTIERFFTFAKTLGEDDLSNVEGYNLHVEIHPDGLSELLALFKNEEFTSSLEAAFLSCFSVDDEDHWVTLEDMENNEGVVICIFKVNPDLKLGTFQLYDELDSEE